MLRLRVPALILVTGFGLACGDTRQELLSPRSPAFSHTPAAACDATIASTIENQAIGAAFSRNQQVSEAKKKFKAIKTACPTNSAQAVALSIAFIDWSLTYWPNGITSSANLTNLWHHLSAYVTPSDQLQFDPSALTYGGVKVCGTAGCTLIGAAKTGGIHIPAGALAGATVFGFWQTDCFASHLNALPLCFDHRAWPSLPSTGFAVPATIAVCPVEGTPPGLLNRALVARKHGNEFKVTGAGSSNPFADVSCINATLVSAEARPIGNRGLFAGLGSRLAELFTPESAYATHPSMTGTTRLLSIWGATDPQVFLGTFTGNTVGAPISLTADVGTWEVAYAAPGSVTAVNGLGDFPSPPSARLAQAGGNASGGPGMQLRGHLTQTTPPDGIYRVTWQSLAASPNVDLVVIAVRDNAGNAVASVQYRRGQSAQSGTLYYHNGATEVDIGPFAQNQKTDFELIVNFYTKQVQVSVNGSVHGTYGFTNAAASNIEQIAMEMNGRDIHVMGWDEISVSRLPDPIN